MKLTRLAVLSCTCAAVLTSAVAPSSVAAVRQSTPNPWTLIARSRTYSSHHSTATISGASSIKGTAVSNGKKVKTQWSGLFTGTVATSSAGRAHIVEGLSSKVNGHKSTGSIEYEVLHSKMVTRSGKAWKCAILSALNRIPVWTPVTVAPAARGKTQTASVKSVTISGKRFWVVTVSATQKAHKLTVVTIVNYKLDPNTMAMLGMAWTQKTTGGGNNLLMGNTSSLAGYSKAKSKPLPTCTA